MNMKVNGRLPVRGNIPAHSLRDGGKSRNISVKIIDPSRCLNRGIPEYEETMLSAFRYHLETTVY
jgi:hypothetical protein